MEINLAKTVIIPQIKRKLKKEAGENVLQADFLINYKTGLFKSILTTESGKQQSENKIADYSSLSDMLIELAKNKCDIKNLDGMHLIIYFEKKEADCIIYFDDKKQLINNFLNP